MEAGSELVRGGLRVWGGRPALVLVATADGVSWLHDVFTALSRGAGGEARRLDTEPEVSLDDVVSLEVRVSPFEPAKAVVTDGEGSVSWTCNVTDWATVASVLEPFLAGRPGHAYLHHGFGGSDEADVVLSFGESSA